MDRSLYIAMSGAKQSLLAQNSNANNLANMQTTGFKSDLEWFRSRPVFGEGYPTRVYAMIEKPGTNFSPGVMQTTERDLDVAINGEGLIAVQGEDGKEAYTRAGDLRITPEGFLRWYFSAVWNERNYQDLWDNYLTPSFKARPNAGGFEGYVDWWSSVERVDVNSVTVLDNDGSHAWVRVNVTFTMLDGRVISNQEYDYDLLFDPARQTWMFDYHP